MRQWTLERDLAVGRKAEAKSLRRLSAKAARIEVFACVRAFGRMEIGDEPFLRGGADIVQAGAPFGLLGLAWVGAGDFHSRFTGQFLDRVHERQSALVGHPADHIAVRPAAEAVVETLLVID